MPIRRRPENMPDTHFRQCRRVKDGEIKIPARLREIFDRNIEHAARLKLDEADCRTLIYSLYALRTWIEAGERRGDWRFTERHVRAMRDMKLTMKDYWERQRPQFTVRTATNTQNLLLWGYLVKSRGVAERHLRILAPSLREVFRPALARRKHVAKPIACDEENLMKGGGLATPNQALMKRIKSRLSYSARRRWHEHHDSDPKFGERMAYLYFSQARTVFGSSSSLEDG